MDPRDFETTNEMRLQSIGTPMPSDVGCANAKLSRHLARAPMRGPVGLILSSPLHQSSHIDLDRWRPRGRSCAMPSLLVRQHNLDGNSHICRGPIFSCFIRSYTSSL